MYTIDLLSDCSERVPYNIADFPAYARQAKLSGHKDMLTASHWHDDLEFGIVVSGHMTYSINGTVKLLHSGEGIFINARQLHSNYSVDGTDCEYICVLLHPSLFCTAQYIREGFVSPLMKNEAVPFSVLKSGVPWQAELMKAIRCIKDRFSPDDGAAVLTVQSLAFRVLALLHENMPRGESVSGGIDRRLVALRNMVGFVQLHYEDKITLADISAAGNVSESGCCAIFQRQLHQTPMGYLSRYRIEKGLVLLDQPDLTVLDVALAVGFSSASYFSETFRKHLGLTPSAYRKRKPDSSPGNPQ